MKFNKQLIIILVLGSLLMSALGAAFYFYKMHQKTVEDSNKKVKIYVANINLEKNKLIEKEHLKTHFVTKQEVLNRPLNSKEIIGKYVKSDIFKNEIFIKEKISSTLPKENDKKFIGFQNNSYNMAFKLFQNPNYTIQKGDYINIVTSNQATIGKLPKYKAQYVAKNIKVLGFIDRGEAVAKAVNRKKVKKKIKKKEVEVMENINATEIVLDLKDKVILDIAENFQKNKNLFFMVKTKNKVVIKPKPKPKATPSKIVRTKKAPVKRNYPYKWYIPTPSTQTTKATIQYADKLTQAPKVQQATLVYDYEKACQQTDKLLIGISRSVYIKSKPSLKSKSVKSIYRNYIIAYTQKVGSWYRLCDGNYAHKNEVRPISKAFAEEKMKMKKNVKEETKKSK